MNAPLILRYTVGEAPETVWAPIRRHARTLGLDEPAATALGAAAAELAAAAHDALRLECAVDDGAVRLMAHGPVPDAAVRDLEPLLEPLGFRVQRVEDGWCVASPPAAPPASEPGPEGWRPGRAYLAEAAERQRQRDTLAQLGRELEDTNRGVVALHGELEQQAERERAAVRVRDELLAIASHDLRSPLTALQMRLEILKRALDRGAVAPAETLERVREQVTHADTQATRLAHMLEVLLDVSRVCAGQLELKEEPLDLERLLRRVVDEARLGYKAQAQCIELRVDHAIEGRWDPLRLEQVVMNLLSNALKYGRGAPVAIQAAVRDRRAIIQVADRGPGIPPEMQKRIFESFTRGEKTERRGSVGLGLWIVRRIVGAMGGLVTLDSEVGAGTTFTVELPLSGPPSEA